MSYLYLTHCSKTKDDSLKGTDIEVTPDRLYTAKFIQNFINACKKKNLNWAILSDKWGIFYPYEKHKWYNLSPDDVKNDGELYLKLFRKVYNELKKYSKIFFLRTFRFHSFYKRLIDDLKKRGICIALESKYSEIGLK